MWGYKQPKRFVLNLFNVVSGSYSFVGVSQNKDVQKKGKLFLVQPLLNNNQPFELQAFIYTKTYALKHDLTSVWKQLRKLDNQAH